MGRKVPIELPPGIVLGKTEYEAQGRYIDCDHVRFVRGKPEKIGGWEQWNDDGDEIGYGCRSILCWQDFNYNLWHVFGTYDRLWVFNQGRVRTNITPFVFSGTLTDPFTTSNGSPVVLVTDTAHGVDVGQYVRFSGASAVGGLTVDGEYQVILVVDADNYYIQHGSSASSTAGPGGGSVTTKYEIAPGTLNVSVAGGWGIGRYGRSTYGTARTTVAYTQLPRFWSLDKYGQYLLALPSDGTLYKWELDTSDRAEAVTNAPTAVFMFVTSERIVMMLGADSELMDLAWCDDDDITDWTPSATNTANTRRLSHGSRLMAGASLAQGVNIIWSDTAAYLLQWTGTNAVYSDRLLASNCGIVGPGAFITVDGVAFWMSIDAFYMFAGGGVLPIPRSDEIDAILDEIDTQQRFKIVTDYVPEFRQIRWSYPSTGQDEPDMYIAVNIDDWSWATGTWGLDSRTSWGRATLVGVVTILATDKYGVIYEHETGVDADGEPLDWHIETAFFDIDEGNVDLNIDGYIPDFQRQTGAIDLTWTSQDLPQSSSTLETVVEPMATTDDIIDLRHYGRQAKFKLSQSDVTGGDFRLGKQRIEVSGKPIKRAK